VAIFKRLTASEADAIVRAGQSPRYRELDRLQRFFDCTQYDTRVGWNDPSDVPLQERKPCIIFPSARAAIESHTNFALGEGKFPTVRSLTNEDDTAQDGLSKADSQKLDAFNERFVSLAHIESASRQLLRMGQAARSACAVLGFRKGIPSVEAVWAKCCTPTFNPQDPDEVIRLEISYRYIEQERDPLTAEWAPVVYQYRRVIDDKSDTTFLPVRIDDKSQFPVSSTPDKTRTVAHNFGVCPVIWWRCMGGIDTGTGYDGHAIHETILSAIEALDMSLSQRHRAALYAGDPQWFLSGIDPDNPVAPQGRRSRVDITADNPTGDPKKTGEWGGALYGVGPNGRGVAKKGPGVVWASESPDAKASLVTLPGEALDAISDHASDVLNKIAETMSWVRIDPIALRGTADISAKAMTIMYAKQLSRVAQLRQDFGDKCLLPMLSLFYRMLIKVGAGAYLPGLAKVMPILLKMQVQIAGGVQIWFAPKLKLQWPDYFDPSDADEMTRVTMSSAALGGGLVTLASAVEHIKSVFGIGNVEQYVETLKKEKADRVADAQAAMGPGLPQQQPQEQQPTRQGGTTSLKALPK
jgi:hypothetical protein